MNDGPAIALGLLDALIGGFALVWYILTVVTGAGPQPEVLPMRVGTPENRPARRKTALPGRAPLSLAGVLRSRKPAA